jgi:hypothetical protein
MFLEPMGTVKVPVDLGGIGGGGRTGVGAIAKISKGA